MFTPGTPQYHHTLTSSLHLQCQTARSSARSIHVLHRVSSSPLFPVNPSSRALSGRLRSDVIRSKKILSPLRAAVAERAEVHGVGVVAPRARELVVPDPARGVSVRIWVLRAPKGERV